MSYPQQQFNNNPNDPFQALWEETNHSTNGLPKPGIYQSSLTAATSGYGKTNGTPQVEVTYAIDGGVGTVKTYFTLKNSKAISYLKRWLSILGHKFPQHHSYLFPVLQQIVAEKPLCLIEVIDNDGFIYAKILERIDPTEGKPGGIYPPEGPAPMQVQAIIPVPPLTGPSGHYQQMMPQQTDPSQLAQPVVPQPVSTWQQPPMPFQPQSWSQPQPVIPQPVQQAPVMATQSPVG